MAAGRGGSWLFLRATTAVRVVVLYLVVEGANGTSWAMPGVLTIFRVLVALVLVVVDIVVDVADIVLFGKVVEVRGGTSG